MDYLAEQQVCIKLTDLYNSSEESIKKSAKLKIAYTNKLSKDSIKTKVDAQMNSLKTGINQINPKFKEGSKNYEETKALVIETLAAYEQSLIKLSEFYDEKIQQLILKRVELEASLIGSIINEEYLYQKYMKRSDDKENDKVKKTIAENLKSAMDKIFKRKNEEKEALDPQVIAKMIDSQEIANEIDTKLENQISRVEEEKKINLELISNIEKEIKILDTEIEKINDRKIKSIYDAMESGGKAVSTTIKKPKFFGRITRFFASRFNTAKVVESTIIDPLKLRIESFKNNELINIQ